jgi:hypothetical protein
VLPATPDGVQFVYLDYQITSLAENFVTCARKFGKVCGQFQQIRPDLSQLELNL